MRIARKTWGIGAAAAVLVAGGLAWWQVALPGPLDFAGGRRVDLSAYRGPSPTGVPPELASADPLTKGKYLTEAADCQACHTVKGGKPFAGGRAFKLPFGTIYTPNITPDRETGIGQWSDAEFLRAVHQGIGRDGTRLYPAFPYASYAMLTDADVLAIRRYLATLAPVHQANRPNTLAFPINQRWLMAIWSAMFNREGVFRPVAERDAQWNRGAYLVEAAGHCGECHTPRTLMQAMNTRRKFAGGAAEGWNAYNITPDTVSGIGQWSAQDLTSYLRQGYAPQRGAASGPMAEVVSLSTGRLTASDLAAMVAYLRSVPPLSSKGLPAMAGPAAPVAASGPSGNTEGKRLFAQACASCHAWSGKGAIVPGQQLTGIRAVNDRTGANVALMVLNGGGDVHRAGTYMPGFRMAYTDAEIAAVANYVTARFGAAPSALTASDVAALRDQ
ncbi:c-type cytochrome [Novosphingobium sp. KACC 22771]|uniref:c-type cytochrome n=1 Tax=Novosphingobium sp. KACC 22771 TaxID=3025670 RepID=UPI0023670D94|nr:cytochrome c [Novosphingobium sp. KACC 22771]WDF73446.1 cytochrome c [Novosphingobium sp. KACC 22771]